MKGTPGETGHGPHLVLLSGEKPPFQLPPGSPDPTARAPGPSLIVSPHSDDTVMSAYGILSRKLLPEPLNMLTIFSWSDYSVLYRNAHPKTNTLMRAIPRPDELVRSAGKNAGMLPRHPWRFLRKLLDLGEAYKVSRIRVDEDIAFSKRVGARFFYSNLPDSKLRHGHAIIDPSWRLETERETLDMVRGVMGSVIRKAGATVVVAPWPYGTRQHIDHRLVNEAAVQVAEETGAELLYVDDQPYSRRPLGSMQDRRGCAYTPTLAKLNSTEMRSKEEAMRIYESQMTPEYFQGVCKPPPGSHEQAPSETLWNPS